MTEAEGRAEALRLLAQLKVLNKQVEHTIRRGLSHMRDVQALADRLGTLTRALRAESTPDTKGRL